MKKVGDIPATVQDIIRECIVEKPTRIERRMTYKRRKFRFSAKVVNDASHRESGKARDVLPYLSNTLAHGVSTNARLFLIAGHQIRVIINID